MTWDMNAEQKERFTQMAVEAARTAHDEAREAARADVAMWLRELREARVERH